MMMGWVLGQDFMRTIHISIGFLHILIKFTMQNILNGILYGSTDNSCDISLQLTCTV